MLFARLAEHTSKRGIVPAVIDYDDGFIKNYVSQRGIAFDHVTYQPNGPIQLEDHEVLITPLSWLYNSSVRNGKSTGRALFWGIHPDNIFANTKFPSILTHAPTSLRQLLFKACFPVRYYRLKSIINYLVKKRSIVLMDQPNVQALKVLGLDEGRFKYLQIPIEIEEDLSFEKSRFDLEGRKIIRVCWLGRIDRDKWFAIKRAYELANKLAHATTQIQFEFHVIGTGSYDIFLDSMCRNSSQVKTKRIGSLSGKELQSYLREYIDIGIGMGTSCLEFAKLGIPTILVELSRRELSNEDESFIWLSDSRNYNLGYYFSERCIYSLQRDTISNLSRVLTTKFSLLERGMQCYQYAKTHHNITTVLQSFIQRYTDSCARLEICNGFSGKWSL